MLKDYNIDVQTLFLRMMMTNAELYTRVMNIMNPNNFDRSVRAAADFMKEYCDKYNMLPDSTQIKAATGIEVELLEDFNDNDMVSVIRPCGHIFTTAALTTWFRSNCRCPVCRYDIRSASGIGTGTVSSNTGTATGVTFNDATDIGIAAALMIG